MRNSILRFLAAGILFSVLARPGNAALVGTTVSGSLTFAGDPSNYFDPGYGFVPTSGYLNEAGTSVTISNSAVEFGFDDGSSLISADFLGDTLTVNDLIETAGTNNGFQMSFTDGALAGKYLAAGGDNFPISLSSIAGDVLTLNYSGGSPTVGQTLSATFNVTSTPEPSNFGALSIAAFGALGIFIARCRRA